MGRKIRQRLELKKALIETLWVMFNYWPFSIGISFHSNVQFRHFHVATRNSSETNVPGNIVVNPLTQSVDYIWEKKLEFKNQRRKPTLLATLLFCL